MRDIIPPKSRLMLQQNYLVKHDSASAVENGMATSAENSNRFVSWPIEAIRLDSTR